MQSEHLPTQNDLWLYQNICNQTVILCCQAGIVLRTSNTLKGKNDIVTCFLQRMDPLFLPVPSFTWPLPSCADIIATFLFTLECYHFIGHVCVLFRVRLLPRKDVVKIRYYFLFDTLTVFAVCFLFTGALKWLAALQMMQHLFFFITWNRQSYTNKVNVSGVRVCKFPLSNIYCVGVYVSTFDPRSSLFKLTKQELRKHP